MTETDHKNDLLRYLREAREALLWKLDGLSEYDVRRPLTGTGTNLLGLLKHLAAVELGYLCDTFDRPHGEPLPDFKDGADPNADMFATEDESREQIVERYRRAWAFADATVEALPLDTVGTVPWWPKERAEATLHHLLVRVLSDTQRHAGQADILRESLDGAAGHRPADDNLPSPDPGWWEEYRARLERIAQRGQPS
ncbi:DinB family protein [Streptomyces sp. VRA16 Mangrove soil]|uniref:DinB family protein n=1 Tax=Streptomyces sp. VRA16 Mangrove soil TaxID=2817434 RepID=UPI001A9E202C|nr:DinB family protein [Streptomyces sp. VRA16 Mangrove soil]MBO1332848.1 DinB family protein [Streptomyces sp. VRA16 Mangrove soil]